VRGERDILVSQEFPSLSLSSERYNMVWILGWQRESADGDEMLDTLETHLPRPWMKMACGEMILMKTENLSMKGLARQHIQDGAPCGFTIIAHNHSQIQMWW